MELKLLWTSEARNDLKDIYDYHLEVAGQRVAMKLSGAIVLSTTVLMKKPEVGQREEFLSNRKQEFRYLVVKNYKVIYWVDREGNIVQVGSIAGAREMLDFPLRG